jgi:hypothetical protein
VNVRHRATEYLANLRFALAHHPEINNLPIALRVPVEGQKSFMAAGPFGPAV